MQKKSVTCFNQGMSRDLGISQLSEQKANFAFENHNIRITAINDNTLYTVTNEKGTKDTDIVLEGTFLGSCNINKYIVVFTTSSEKDFIYRLSVEDNYITSYLLYEGDLNFNVNNPIDAIGYYESEEVQKVYWVDGLNTNRFINVANDSNGQPPTYNSENIYQFDFQGHINTIPTVTIVKNYDKVGSFQAGTIQYFATYYNKYGVETCIVWQSDLQYISLPDRGANPDEAVNCVFDFTIDNVDTSYQYMRIYATYRAGLNSNAEGRLVTELQINNSTKLTFSDQGLYQNYNAKDIFYIGGQNIIASTLDYKQDTLFLGDIKIDNSNSTLEEIKTIFRDSCINNTNTYDGIDIYECPYIDWQYKKISDFKQDTTDYSIQIKKSQQDIAGFKYRELYRFGIQFMTYTGEWTSAIWIGDKYCNLKPLASKQIPAETTHYGITFYNNYNQKVKGLFYKVYNASGDNYLDGYYLLVDIGEGQKFYSTGSPWRDLKEVEYSEEESREFRYSLKLLEGYDVLDSRNKQAEETIIKEAYVEEGLFIAQAVFNFPTQDLYAHMPSYKAYRLLVAETGPSTRRILTQGVINPTMFNYKDRENNQPFSINSWVFRPRQSNIVNRHFDTLPLQNTEYAELQGVMSRQLPGFKEDKDAGNDCFFFIFAPNYLAGCRLQYKLIYYKLDSCSNFTQSEYADILEVEEGKTLSNEVLTGKDAALAISKSNQCIKEDSLKEGKIIPYHFSTFEVVSEGLINETTWKKVQSKVISKITADTKKAGYEVVISKNMLPTAEQYKRAWQANDTNARSIGAFIGLGVALAASIVASIFSFGAATPALAAVVGTTVTLAASLTAVGLAAASAASVLAAIGAAAGIATVADQVKNNPDLKDIDKELAKKGIYSILDNHTLSMRRQGAKVANTILDMMFKDYSTKDSNPFKLTPTNDSVGSDSNFYSIGGRLTLLKEKERDKDSKQSSFYVDESIVTLNTPNIQDIQDYASDSQAYRLDLVGTIPINSISTDYTMYAEQGLANTSQVIPGLKYKDYFQSKGLEGLYNGFLYQDSKWPDLEDDNQEYEEIQATAALSAYKVFMWNRNTSWSLWVPSVKIKDVYGNELTTPPAKPIKKIFANYKYSEANNFYDDIFSIDIDSPKVFNSDQNILTKLDYNDSTIYYNGNIDSVVIPQEDYTIIADDNTNEFFINKETNKVTTQLRDPIPLRYKSTPHMVIPIKWNYLDNSSTILPYTKNESKVAPWDLYKEEYTEELDYILTSVLGSTDKVYIQPEITEGWDENIYNYFELGYRYGDLYNSPFSPDFDLRSLQIDQTVPILLQCYILYLALPEERQWYINKLWSDLKSQTGEKVTYNNMYEFFNLDIVNHWLQEFQYGINYVYLEDTYTKIGYVLQCTQDGLYVKNIYEWGQGQIPDKFLALISTDILEQNSLPDEKQPYPTLYTTTENKKLVENSEGQWNVLPREENEGYTYGYYTDNGWTQGKLNWEESYPYLFLGEIVKKDFNYNEWYNGISDYALQQINWNVCSGITEKQENIDTTWGDTYYQRWDCLKTYPYTEQEVNSNVEVLSFMIESHTNLDGRSDVNRGDTNLINLRPSNSNIINNVYSQQDNFFQYKVLDEKFSKNEFGNQVVWSLSKNNLDNIDKWTSVSAVNTLQLDGKLGKINKVINVNNTLLAFQDKGISTIDYNLQAALTTYEGVPLQMGNTGKVTGYTLVTDNIGCLNKGAIVLSNAGLFFIDDYNNSLIQYTANEGLQNLSNNKLFSTWFKDNIIYTPWDPTNNAFRLNYDSLTQDLYIQNKTTCLVYNVQLDAFTSFMSYTNTPLLFNNNGKSIALNQKEHQLKVWELFEGNYDNIYNTVVPYSIEYRINPSPNTDNMFTNYQYDADLLDEKTNKLINGPQNCFDTVEAWNEYQHGILSIRNTKFNNPKFRIWRGDIPRDGDTTTNNKLKADRMRNPWIHLKLSKNNPTGKKMIFHNLNIIYYN